jgi:hypothetical protein
MQNKSANVISGLSLKIKPELGETAQISGYANKRAGRYSNRKDEIG